MLRQLVAVSVIGKPVTSNVSSIPEAHVTPPAVHERIQLIAASLPAPSARTSIHFPVVGSVGQQRAYRENVTMAKDCDGPKPVARSSESDLSS